MVEGRGSCPADVTRAALVGVFREAVQVLVPYGVLAWSNDTSFWSESVDLAQPNEATEEMIVEAVRD